MPKGHSYRDQTTLHLDKTSTGSGIPRAIGLTVLYHPDINRIGEVAPLLDVESKASAPLSRVEPVFRTVDGHPVEALATPALSRKPIEICAAPEGGVRISNSPDGTRVVADGQLLEGDAEFPREKLQTGVVLELAKSVVLLLHTIDISIKGDDDTLGLVGDSTAIRQVRIAIRQVADLEVPVLLHGETGVGKELVASAIHECSRRASKPYVCVNMAAIPPSLAASELFGYAKGAFTGATNPREGYFVEAHGGTLFLDELGDTPEEVQPLLLRAIENKKVQPLGGKIRDIDVRLIAATDSNLERAIDEGLFRRPLLERIAGYKIKIAPLRERRDDIGRLLVFFMRNELEKIGETYRLNEPAEEKPWMPASVAAKLVRFDWPGNVRQLQNVTRQLVISNRGAHEFRMDPSLESVLGRVSTKTTPLPLPASVPLGKRRPSEFSDEEIADVWRKNQFNFNATADELNVSRSWLNTRLEGISSIRKAKDIGAEEIIRCSEACGHDLEATAAKLQVSVRALQLQKKRLGIR